MVEATGSNPVFRSIPKPDSIESAWLWTVRLLVRSLPFQGIQAGFESRTVYHRIAVVAQSVERCVEGAGVAGSIPADGTTSGVCHTCRRQDTAQIARRATATHSKPPNFGVTLFRAGNPASAWQQALLG